MYPSKLTISNLIIYQIAFNYSIFQQLSMMKNDTFLQKLYSIKPFKQIESPNTRQAKQLAMERTSNSQRQIYLTTEQQQLNNVPHAFCDQLSKNQMTQSQIINNIAVSFDSLFERIERVKQEFRSQNQLPKSQKSVRDLEMSQPLQLKKISSALSLKRAFSIQEDLFKDFPTLTSFRSNSLQQNGKQFKKRDSVQKTIDQKNIIVRPQQQMTLENAARAVDEVQLPYEVPQKQNIKNLLNFKKNQKAKSEQQIFVNEFSSKNKNKKPTSLKTVSQPNLNEIFQKVQIRDFQLGKCLGSGKFGDVYVCKHKKTNTMYALKKIFKSTIIEYKMQDQLIKELKIHYRLNHPNIIKLYTHFQDEFHIFLLMEYADGGVLMEHLKKGEAFTSQVLFQMLQAVDYMQKNQVAHRDIKPQNIVICQDGTMKICDFGWASTFQNQMKTTFCGTLDYVSPEMKDRGIYTMSVDIWSLGVLTFELLCGFAPLKDEINYWKLKGGSIDKQWNWDILYPPHLSYKAESFMRSILKENPEERATIRQCLKHPFIKDYMNQCKNEHGMTGSQFTELVQETRKVLS